MDLEWWHMPVILAPKEKEIKRILYKKLVRSPISANKSGMIVHFIIPATWEAWEDQSHGHIPDKKAGEPI
jgi:hypothetical protein